MNEPFFRKMFDGEMFCARVLSVQDAIEADLLAAEAELAGLVLINVPGSMRTAWMWLQPFAVCTSATGGLGGFAVVSYAPNDVILAEAPLVRWRQSMHVTSQENLAGLHRELEALSPTTRDRYYALHQSELQGEGKSAIGIWMSNAYTTDESDPDVEDAAVFELLSRLNHACRPNAMRRWCEERGELIVSATRAIVRGEEITVSYLGDSEEECLRVPREVRQKYLLDTFGFRCGCMRCERGDEADDAKQETLERSSP